VHDFHPLLENRLVVFERDGERQILAPVIAAVGGEIDPAAVHQV
jgi:hypothetical protein